MSSHQAVVPFKPNADRRSDGIQTAQGRAPVPVGPDARASSLSCDSVLERL
jgi:hypothetical protein